MFEKDKSKYKDVLYKTAPVLRWIVPTAKVFKTGLDIVFLVASVLIFLYVFGYRVDVRSPLRAGRHKSDSQKIDNADGTTAPGVTDLTNPGSGGSGLGADMVTALKDAAARADSYMQDGIFATGLDIAGVIALQKVGMVSINVRSQTPVTLEINNKPVRVADKDLNISLPVGKYTVRLTNAENAQSAQSAQNGAKLIEYEPYTRDFAVYHEFIVRLNILPIFKTPGLQVLHTWRIENAQPARSDAKRTDPAKVGGAGPSTVNLNNAALVQSNTEPSKAFQTLEQPLVRLVGDVKILTLKNRANQYLLQDAQRFILFRTSFFKILGKRQARFFIDAVYDAKPVLSKLQQLSKNGQGLKNHENYELVGAYIFKPDVLVFVYKGPREYIVLRYNAKKPGADVAIAHIPAGQEFKWFDTQHGVLGLSSKSLVYMRAQTTGASNGADSAGTSFAIVKDYTKLKAEVMAALPQDQAEKIRFGATDAEATGKIEPTIIGSYWHANRLWLLMHTGSPTMYVLECRLNLKETGRLADASVPVQSCGIVTLVPALQTPTWALTSTIRPTKQAENMALAKQQSAKPQQAKAQQTVGSAKLRFLDLRVSTNGKFLYIFDNVAQKALVLQQMQLGLQLPQPMLVYPTFRYDIIEVSKLGQQYDTASTTRAYNNMYVFDLPEYSKILPLGPRIYIVSVKKQTIYEALLPLGAINLTFKPGVYEVCPVQSTIKKWRVLDDSIFVVDENSRLVVCDLYKGKIYTYDYTKDHDVSDASPDQVESSLQGSKAAGNRQTVRQIFDIVLNGTLSYTITSAPDSQAKEAAKDTLPKDKQSNTERKLSIINTQHWIFKQD